MSKLLRMVSFCGGLFLCGSDLLSAAAANPEVLPVTVCDAAGLSGPRPVTGGVPIPEGAVRDTDSFLLSEGDGKQVPLQTKVLARWKDGSVRWLLLDFQASPPRKGKEKFTLKWNVGRTKKAVPESAVRVVEGRTAVLETDGLRVSVPPGALLRIDDRADVDFVMLDEKGRTCRAFTESVEKEAPGPLRGTLLLRGSIRDQEGKRKCGFRLKVSVFAGLGRVYLETQLLMDAEKGFMHRLRGLYFTFKFRRPLREAVLGGKPAWRGKVRERGCLAQGNG